GVGGGPPDPVLLQLLDERRLGEARRRLREVLAREQALQLERLALGEARQAASLLVVRVGIGGALILRRGVLVLPLVVDGEPPRELQDRAGRPEGERPRGDVRTRRVEDGGLHLRRDEAVPDELVQAELVAAEEILHPV